MNFKRYNKLTAIIACFIAFAFGQPVIKDFNTSVVVTLKRINETPLGITTSVSVHADSKTKTYIAGNIRIYSLGARSKSSHSQSHSIQECRTFGEWVEVIAWCRDCHFGCWCS